MLTVISCRESSANSDRFGAHVIPGRSDRFDGGPVGRPVLIHGYNCTESQAVGSGTAFANAIGQECVAYSWPGGCHALDFPAAVGRATLAGYRLRDVFSMRYGRSSAEQIITHSLGARVALSALNHSGLAVKTLILMAPALDWNAFEHGGEFELVPSCCEAVHILYSNRDEVLKLAYPIGDIGGGSHALGLDGPRDPLQVPHNVFLHDVSAFIPNHTSYLSEPKCAKLVRQILGT